MFRLIFTVRCSQELISNMTEIQIKMEVPMISNAEENLFDIPSVRSHGT